MKASERRKDYSGMATIKDARGQNTKINYGEKEKRTSKKNVDGRSTSSHENKKLRTRSMEKQRGMAFCFRKTATAVKKKTERQTDIKAIRSFETPSISLRQKAVLGK